jgi:UDP-glucose 6-dehydrogenase
MRGFGGKCFPKDLGALIGEYEKAGVDASFLRTVWEKNLHIRKRGPDGLYDWQNIPGVVSNNH